MCQSISKWFQCLQKASKYSLSSEYTGTNEIYHFGSGVRKTNLEVVKTILKLMNKPESLINFVPDRPGHDRKYALSYAKAANILNWWPNKQFEEGLSIVIEDIIRRSNDKQ